MVPASVVVPPAVQAVLDEAAGLKTADDYRAAEYRFKELHKKIISAGGEEHERKAWLDLYFGHLNAFRDARRAARDQRDQRNAELANQLRELLVEAEALAAADVAADAVDQRAKDVQALQAKVKNVGTGGGGEANKLRRSIRAVCDKAYAPVLEAREARDWERFAHVPAAEELIAKAKAAVDIEDGEERLNTMKGLQKEWRQLGSLPRSKNDELWEQFKAAGDAVFESLKEWFAERDSERAGHYEAKQQLIAELEAIIAADNAASSSSSDSAEDDGESAPTADELRAARQERSERVRAMQDEWKNIGPVPRELDKEQYHNWKNLLDGYFGKRRQAYEAVREEQLENLRNKQALIAEAQDLAEDVAAWKEGRRPGMDETNIHEQVRDIRRSWKNIGYVPKDQVEGIWQRFNEALQPINDILEPWYQQRDEERKGNLEAKQAIIKEIEELLEEEHPEWFGDQLRDLQNKWRDIGPVPRDDYKALNDKYFGLINQIKGERQGAVDFSRTVGF